MTSAVSDIAEHTAVSVRRYAYPASREACAAARRDIGRALKDLHLDADTVDVGMLAVSELFANAVLHHTPRPGEQVAVALDTQAGPGGIWAVLSVIDGGNGAIGTPSRSSGGHGLVARSGADRESGRGLALLRGLGARVRGSAAAAGYEVTVAYPIDQEIRRRVCRCDCGNSHPRNAGCLTLVTIDASEADLTDDDALVFLCSRCQLALIAEQVREAGGSPAQIGRSKPSIDLPLREEG